jgi:hypothetical protein
MPTARSTLAFAAISLAAVACDKKSADVPCESVVAELMSYQRAAGEPERKLFASIARTWMRRERPASWRAPRSPTSRPNVAEASPDERYGRIFWATSRPAWVSVRVP